MIKFQSGLLPQSNPPTVPNLPQVTVSAPPLPPAITPGLAAFDSYANALEQAFAGVDARVAALLGMRFMQLNGGHPLTSRWNAPPGRPAPEQQTIEQPYNPPQSALEEELQLEEQQIMGKPGVGPGAPGESPAPEDPFIDF